MSWRIADTGEVIDINYSQNRPKRLKTTINDDSITIASNSDFTSESLPKGWKLADENLQAPKGWRLADEPKPLSNYSNFPNNSNSLTTPKGWRLADESVNSPKIEKRLSPNQEQITQSPTLQDFRQSFERLQNNPKNEFMDNKSTSQTPTIKEDYTPKDFFWDVAKGVDRGYMKIGAGINKALDKITPDYVQEYWEQKYKENPNLKNRIFHAMTDTKNNYYRNQHLINKDNAEIKNKYAGLGGEIVGDPTIMLPLGILGKTRGFKNTVKSGLAGATIATPAGALKDYGDESVSNKQMMSNTLINALTGGGINSLLASKTGNVLVNKIANAYRGARGKERVAYSNFRRGVEVPLAPEQTNSQIFENIKNVYDDIGIDTPLPKANIVPYNETFARNQAQNSEVIKGDGFRMDKNSQPPFTDYNVKTEVDEWVKNLSELERSELEANLYTLYKKHPELYQGPADVYRDLIQIKNNPTYFFKNNRPDISLISKKLNDGSLGKLGVVKDSGYVGHVSRSSKYQKEMDRLRLSNEKQLEVGAPYPTLPRTDINQAELTAGAKAHSQAVNRNILPSQNLKAPITTDDIFKEAISLHRSGFKFGKDINENINLVLNKIKNDRLNATNNTQMPNNELLPQPKAPEHNPNWYDEFVKNKPANMDMNYLKKYYDVDGFLNDRAGVLAKDIRYNNRQIEPSKIVDNQGYGGWEYKKTRQITEPNYNADFQITKADVNAIKNGTATNQTIQKLADDLEASKYLGYGYDNFSKNVDNYLTSLEQRGIKPELISSLRQKLVNEPELFTPQRIKETEEFIKNNPTLVLKAPKNEPISKKLTDDATYDFKSENIFTDLRKNKIGDLNRHPKVFEALKNLDEANARAEFKLKNFNNETFLQEKARLNADFLSKDDVKKILQNEIEFRISNLEAIDKFYNMHPKALNKKELLKMADELENINKDLDDILNVNIVKPILNSAKRKLDQNVYDIKITDNPIQKNKYRQILEKELNITPIKEFGKNYAEFYHNPHGAINKLLAEKKGQVAGAFYRKDLGDIDLVWGDTKIGLRKILDKHIDDFSEFGNDINAVGKALDEIINKGKLVNKNGVETIWYKKGDNFYLVGLAKGYNKVGDNKWVITSYKKTKGAIPDEIKGNTANLSAYSGKFKGELTSSHPPLTSSTNNIPQNTLNNNKMKGGFTTQAMAKNIVSSGIGGGIGAYSAPEDKKLEGFIIGALGGMGASNFGGISHSTVILVKNMIKTPKGIDKAIEKGVDKGLVGVANKFLSKEAAKTWSEVGGNVANLKYLFTNTLDKSYEKVRDSVTGELNAMFNKYVNLSSVLNQLSKKDNKAFYDFLANNGSIENLSPEIRKFANDVRNQIIKEFEYQVGAKLVDENTAKEFSGNFLSRIYENEGLKSKFKDWISSGSSAFGIDPIYKRGLEKTIGIGEYQRLKALGKIAVKGDKGFSTGGKWILNEPYDEKTLLKMADENTKIKIRRDYTADERAKMGEVTDIARVLPQTLYKMASRRINNEFLSKTLDLAKNTDKILAPDELLPHLKELQKAGNEWEIMRLGYMQIPDNDKFGVLKGKFLRRDVAYDISQKIESFRDKSLGKKIYTDYLNAWKWAKTVGNTTGHFNNFVGNAFLMKLAGLQTRELKGMVTNIEIIKDAGKFSELKMKEKLGNITGEELMWLNENRAKFKNYELASNVGLFGRSRLNDMGIDNSFTFKEGGTLRKIGKFANDMYGAEDDVARLTMFDALLKRGKTPQEAKEFTNLLMPDYTRYMPPAIRWAKNWGIAPFISWTYYVIPSVFKLAGTKTGLNNIASTFALMFTGSYLMTGINPFGKDMPDNNKGKYLPVYKKGDTVTSLKIDRVIPYAEWLNPMNFGEAPFEAMGTMATAPIAKAVSDTKNLVLNRKIPINDFTNRPVTYSNKPIGEKTYDISKYMVQQHTPLPATASNVWNFIESLARTQKQRKTNDTFVPRSTTQEIIKLLGPNLSNHSIKGLNADRKRKERREKKRAK